MATYQMLLRTVDYIINENGIVDKKLLQHAFKNQAIIQTRLKETTNTLQIESLKSKLVVVFDKNISYNDLIEFYNRFVTNCIRLCHDLNTPFITMKAKGNNGKIMASYEVNEYFSLGGI